MLSNPPVCRMFWMEEVPRSMMRVTSPVLRLPPDTQGTREEIPRQSTSGMLLTNSATPFHQPVRHQMVHLRALQLSHQ